ncbi:MAG: hypothetical protein ABI591_16595 [Kofleriaceae bacterium]
MRAKFRETLWFKKGEKDAQVAAETDPHDVMAPKAADLMPIEDRYNDDQEDLAPIDSVAFGIHTGRTEYLPTLAATSDGSDPVDEGLMVKDLKRGRRKVFAMIGAGAALVVGVVVAFAAL